MGGAVPPSPPGPPPAAPSTAAPVPLAEAAVVHVPERLAALARPVVLTGTVADQAPDGLTRVRTQAGDVLLKSPAPLPADRPVTLQIAAGQPPGRAVVLTAAAPTAPRCSAQLRRPVPRLRRP